MARRCKKPGKNPQHLEPRRVCVFCGGTPLSKEHFWPDWAAEYMPQVFEHFRSRTRGLFASAEEELIYHVDRQGHVGTVRHRVVCKNCNETWMSRMETEIRPILEPMLLGRNVVVLEEAHKRLLAEYITLKVMVADQSSPQDAVFSPAEYAAFYERRDISPFLSIGIRRYVSADNTVGMYNRESALVRGEDGMAWSGPSTVNFTYRFGQLLIQAVVGRDAEPFVKPSTIAYIQLWPSEGTTARWPLKELTTMQAFGFQHILHAVGQDAKQEVQRSSRDTR